MITARYEPHLFPKEHSPHLGRRGCTPPPSNDGSDDIDRFMELAHAALEEATKEEDAKGILQELVERVLARTGAPLMAGIITEQLRSQEVIEQLAERSFERQALRRRQRLHQESEIRMKHRRNNVPSLSHRPSSSPLQRTKPIPSSKSAVSSFSSISSSISAPTSASSTSISSLKDPHDPDTMDEEAVTRDQFIIQQTSSLHTQPDRLLLVSEYIWRLFRLLILACLVALVYHYVCSYPQQWFI